MKRYLRAPEEVTQALQEGKKVQTDYMEYWLSKGVFFSLNKKDSCVCINSSVLFIPDCMYVNEPKPLKLEVGKFYKTRDGRQAFVYTITENAAYPCWVVLVDSSEGGTYCCTIDGQYTTNEENNKDLVASWEEAE